MIDTGKIYTLMCAEAAEIQSYFQENLWELLPSFVFFREEKQEESSGYCFQMNSKDFRNLEESCKQESESGFLVVNDISSGEPKNIADIKKCFQGSVWLPSPSQLQKMCSEDVYGILIRFSFFIRKAKFKDTDEMYASRFRTVDQAWLAFAMHWTHSKAWKNRKWVDVSEEDFTLGK